MRAEWQNDAIAQFSVYSNTDGNVVFADGSITATILRAEYFSSIDTEELGADE